MSRAPVLPGLSERGVEPGGELHWINREGLPVLKALRRLANAAAVSTVESITSSTTIAQTTDVVLADATAGNITVTLAPAASWVKVSVIKVDVTANTVTISTTAFGDVVLTDAGYASSLVCDGTNYYRVGQVP